MENMKKHEPFFGSWHISRLIGEGSFGKVYEIERCEFGKTYRSAMKAISVPQNKNEISNMLHNDMDEKSIKSYLDSVAENVIREIELMTCLKGNSNIVCYEDHIAVEREDEIGWDIFIRMELLRPIDEYFGDYDYSVRDIVNLGIDMCKALEICQKNNIMHRDIKPENIFISNNGDFKLGDFGIAKTIEKSSNTFLSKKGTCTYMAPEVYKCEEYDFSVDIYSVGIVLYRYLNNNRAPFQPQPPEILNATNIDAAFLKRMSGETISFPANTDKELAEIVLKACAYNPDERYGSPEEMRVELETVLKKMGFDENKIPSGKQCVSSKPENNEKTENGENPSINKRIIVLCIIALIIVALSIVTIFFGNKNNSEKFITGKSTTEAITETNRTTRETTQSPQMPSTEVSEKHMMIVVTEGDNLNVRADKSIEATIITSIPKVTEVEVTKVEDGWAYIICPEAEGWVKIEYLKNSNPSLLSDILSNTNIAVSVENDVARIDYINKSANLKIKLPENYHDITDLIKAETANPHIDMAAAKYPYKNDFIGIYLQDYPEDVNKNNADASAKAICEEMSKEYGNFFLNPNCRNVSGVSVEFVGGKNFYVISWQEVSLTDKIYRHNYVTASENEFLVIDISSSTENGHIELIKSISSIS